MDMTISLEKGQGKESLYKQLLPQIEHLVAGERDAVANLANVMAVLKESFPWLWVGVYRVDGQELVLGPFQGPLACTRIAFGKGVCGTAWKEKKSIVVPDVDAFPGHIACSSLSRSEIVVPLIHDDEVVGVLDVDSPELNAFDEVDQMHLEQLGNLLSKLMSK